MAEVAGLPEGALGALLPVLALAAVHLLATHVRSWAGRHESAVVSAAGGASVAYVFLHLLPEVAVGATVAGEALDGLVRPVPLTELVVFVVALAGFTVFYLAERYAERRGSARHHGGDGQASREAFAVHLVAFAAYNAAVAYTLPARVADDALGAAVFTVAIAVHVLVVDRGLVAHYPERYGHVGRFVLVGGLGAGWAAAVLAGPTSALAVSLTTAVVAGAVLLTVFQEELPRAGRSRVGPFLAGLAVYSAVLVVLTVVAPHALDG